MFHAGEADHLRREDQLVQGQLEAVFEHLSETAWSRPLLIGTNDCILHTNHILLNGVANMTHILILFHGPTPILQRIPQRTTELL